MKIRVICDTPTDIPKETAEKLNIDVLTIPITVDGVGYEEGVDFTPEDFINILENATEIPTTAHVTIPRFFDCYVKNYEEGYNKMVVTTINGKGSNTCTAAQMAADLFFHEYPDAVEQQVEIKVFDGQTYTLGYGFPVMQAAQMVQDGKEFESVVHYLEDTLNSMEIYFSVFTLKYAKKSGRISTVAAFAGEMLGLRPVMEIKEGEINTVAKVRGNSACVPAIVERFLENCPDLSMPYIILRGKDPGPAKELEKLMKAKTGHKSAGTYLVGPCIMINAGPDLVGLAYVGKNRAAKQK